MGCAASASKEGEEGVTVVAEKAVQKLNERDTRKTAAMLRHQFQEKEKPKVFAFPLFKMPTTKAGEEEHEIECVFFGVKDDSCTEVNIFFRETEEKRKKDEPRPIALTLIKNEARTGYEKVAFHKSYGGTQQWEGGADSPPPHSHVVPFSDFETVKLPPPDLRGVHADRPVFYVNTSEHLLGIRSTNSGDHSTLANFPIYTGDGRQAVEIVLRGLEAAYPERKEVSPLAELIPVRSSHSKPKVKPAGTS